MASATDNAKAAKQITIPVSGMTCAACQANVQRALEQAPGVRTASVNLMTHQATVAYDGNATTPEALVEAIRDTGFDAELPAPGRTAMEEQEALIRSDYAAIEAVSGRMQEVADGMDRLEARRSAIVTELGAGETLEELLPLAETHGMAAFAPLRERLLAEALQLREAQERNARLILSAVKLRERWYALLAGMSAPTYGAEGRQELRGSRGLVSKSA